MALNNKVFFLTLLCLFFNLHVFGQRYKPFDKKDWDSILAFEKQKHAFWASSKVLFGKRKELYVFTTLYETYRLQLAKTSYGSFCDSFLKTREEKIAIRINSCEENEIVHFVTVTTSELKNANTDEMISDLFEEDGTPKSDCLPTNKTAIKKMVILSLRGFTFYENPSDGCLRIGFKNR